VNKGREKSGGRGRRERELSLFSFNIISGKKMIAQENID